MGNDYVKRISNDIAAGCVMFSGSLGGVKTFHDIGHHIASNYEADLGRIGSAVVEYELPAIVGICFAKLTYDVVKAMDKYQLEKKG